MNKSILSVTGTGLSLALLFTSIVQTYGAHLPSAAAQPQTKAKQPVQRKSQPTSSQETKSKPGNKPAKEIEAAISPILPSLEQGFHVTGTATLEDVSRNDPTDPAFYPRTPRRLHFQQTRLGLRVVNDTNYNIQFGQVMALIEIGIGDKFEGALIGVRVPQLSKDWDAKGAYGLSTHITRYTDGSQSTIGPSWLSLLLDSVGKDDTKEDTIPAEVAAHGEVLLHITLNEANWLRDKDRTSLRLAFPEVRVVTRRGTGRYRLLVTFKKSATDNKVWDIEGHNWIHLDRDTLTSLAASDSTDLVMRILAVNWWIEMDPTGARSALAQIGQTLHKGELLSTCLQLMIQYKDEGLSAHATDLLKTPNTPSGILLLAIRYLVALGQDPDVTPILGLASGEDEEVARQAIFTLGRFKTPRSIEGLQSLLRNPKLSARHEQIRSNLK